MATVSILANPLANTSSSSFSEPPQIISNPSNAPSDQPQASASQSDGNQSVTEVIIEALRSKDRLFVLKLGEQMEALINERKSVLRFSYTIRSRCIGDGPPVVSPHPLHIVPRRPTSVCMLTRFTQNSDRCEPHHVLPTLACPQMLRILQAGT